MDVGLVCDACGTLNPVGASSCSRCSAALSLGGKAAAAPEEPAPGTPDEIAAAIGAATPAVTFREPVGNTKADAAPEASSTDPAEALINCASCGSQVPARFKFCPKCGAAVGDAASARAPAAPAPAPAPAATPPPAAAKKGGGGRKTMFFGAMQAARAKLVLIKGDGLDGVSFTLAGDDHIAGRVDAPLLFDEDPYLSPTHANFYYRSGQLIAKDMGSRNGIFLRIRGSVPIQSGDRCLIGEQILRVEATPHTMEDPQPKRDGTYFFSGPRRASPFRVVQMLRGGDTGLAFSAQGDAIVVGREENDINFPDDPFISGRHAQISVNGSQLTLTDLGSKNGTFLRVNDEQPLTHGDYVFMGQQLLRVEIV